MEHLKKGLNKNEFLMRHRMKENQINHSFNLARFTGYYHGLYYMLGIYQPNTRQNKSSKI